METGHQMCRTRDRTASRVRGVSHFTKCADNQKTRLVVGTNKDLALLRVRGEGQHNTIREVTLDEDTIVSSAVSSILYSRDVAENHTKPVKSHRTAETWQVSMNGNFALEDTSLGKLVIKTSRRCLKSAPDCVATVSPRHKKLASTICVKLLMEDHVGIEALINHMRETVLSPRLNTGIVVQKDSYLGRMEKLWNSMSRGDDVAGHS